MSWTFADGFNRIAFNMATYALLGLNDWILMVDRVGFLEIPRCCVTGIAIPAIRIHRGMHRVRWMPLGKIDGIIVGAIVAGSATRGEGWMYRAYKRIGLGKAACDRAIDAGTVGGVRVTLAAISRCGDVTCRF